MTMLHETHPSISVILRCKKIMVLEWPTGWGSRCPRKWQVLTRGLWGRRHTSDCTMCNVSSDLVSMRLLCLALVPDDVHRWRQRELRVHKIRLSYMSSKTSRCEGALPALVLRNPGEVLSLITPVPKLKVHPVVHVVVPVPRVVITEEDGTYILQTWCIGRCVSGDLQTHTLCCVLMGPTTMLDLHLQLSAGVQCTPSRCG